VKVRNEYLINYVGMASRSVRGRLADHLSAFLSGQYWVYEAEKFKHGSRSSVAYEPSGEVWDFANEYMENSRKIHAQLAAMSLFFLPVEADKDVLMKIESSIIRTLWNDDDDQVREFLDNARVSTLNGPETSQPLRIRGYAGLRGLSDDLTVS
jgi:hypothetical protein